MVLAVHGAPVLHAARGLMREHAFQGSLDSAQVTMRSQLQLKQSMVAVCADVLIEQSSIRVR